MFRPLQPCKLSWGSAAEILSWPDTCEHKRVNYYSVVVVYFRVCCLHFICSWYSAHWSKHDGLSTLSLENLTARLSLRFKHFTCGKLKAEYGSDKTISGFFSIFHKCHIQGEGAYTNRCTLNENVRLLFISVFQWQLPGITFFFLLPISNAVDTDS